jgi:heme-degrading monooxygenase HmoA
MHARIATFEGIRLEHVEVLRRLERERFTEENRRLPGYAGNLSLVDTGAGRALAVILFDSKESLEAAHRELDAMSPPDELRGIRRTSVDFYEVGLQELSGEPRAARVSRLEGPRDSIDAGVQHATDNILPRARNIDGWLGAFMLADRESGTTVLITLWESPEALRASEEEANRLRQESAEAMGDSIEAVERYEVVGVDVPARAASR